MKKLLLILFIIILSFQLKAQRKLSYYDVYEIVKSTDADRAYTLLVAIQKQDPEFANTYYQLGAISKKWAFEFNPFTEFDYIKLFIYNSKLYFDLALLKIQKEKKKNLEFYSNTDIKFEGKFPTFDEIVIYINSQRKEIKDFEENISDIINFFNKSSDHYNECVKTYMEINVEYGKIKNIYLTEDENFLSKLNQLETHFDSAIYYFNEYKESLKKYPLKGYNQNIELKEIVTYRLDGLTNSNFLNEKISLWDYKKWVNSVKKTMNETVTDNRKEIIEQNSELKNKIDQLKENSYSDVYKPVKLDDKFIYKIEKFDNNSLLIKLFKLNESLIDYLTIYRRTINDPKHNDDFSLFSIAEYCLNLHEKKNAVDSINNIFISSLNKNEIKKYQKFYSSSYSGLDGLTNYSDKQKEFLTVKQDEALYNLKNRLYTSVYNISGDSIIYKSKRIELKKNFPDINNVKPESYTVTDIKFMKEINFGFSGFYKLKNGKISGFHGISRGYSNLKFLKTHKKDTSNIFCLVNDVYRDGSFTVETSVKQTIKNSLVQYDKSGKLISRKPLPINKIPRFMSYDDINNSVVIVFYGEHLDETSADNSAEQIMYQKNLTDESKSFFLRIAGNSYIFDIIRTEGKIFIFSNYIYYLKNGGSKVISKAGNNDGGTNIMLSIISSDGILEDQIHFENDQAFFGVKALKLNSNTINILGYKSEYLNKDYKELLNKDLYYLLIDSKAKEIYSTWHD